MLVCLALELGHQRGDDVSLFQCDNCGCIENTALTSGYVGWTSDEGDWAQERINRGLKVHGRYCSACFDGKWHGRFLQKFYPIGTAQTDKNGNIRLTRPDAL